MGHARALVSVADPERAATLANRTVEEGWSVRELERRIRPSPRPNRRRSTSMRSRDPMFTIFEEALQEHLAARVRITARKAGGGEVRLNYRNSRDLERIFEEVTGRKIETLAD